MEDNRLFIKIPGKPHIMSAEIGRTNGPRILREVEGDFTAEVRTFGAFPNDPRSLVEGRWPYNGAGLLIWHDDKNYLLLQRARMHFPDGQWRCWPNWQARQNAKATEGWSPNAGALEEVKAVTLRIVRKGEICTGSYRPDGGAWQELAPIRTEYGNKVQVGIVATQNTATGYEASFEDLRIIPVRAAGPK